MYGDTFKEYEELDSTQLEAKRLISIHNITKTTVISAKRQEFGRGRYERVWYSDCGDVMLTIIMRPRPAIDKWSQCSYIGALAVGETILKYAKNSDITYKWVNDVFAGGKKISGILLETFEDSALLLGIGVNIVKKRLAGFEIEAASLQDFITQIDRLEFIHSLLEKFFVLYESWEHHGFLPIKEMWLKRARSLNSTINVRFLGKEVRGQFKDIDEHGRLLLDTGGSIKAISSGEI